jgi:hypothetical protein
MTFDRRFYTKLLLISISLNICWTFLGSMLANYLEKDLGLMLIGLVFLLIYSTTFFLMFDKNKKNIYNFLMLTLVLICIFLASTFVVVPFFFFVFDNKFFQIIGSVISSFFPIVAIVSFLTRYKPIQNKTLTIVVTICLTFIKTLLFVKFLESFNFDTENLNTIINPMALGFCIWQILTTSIIGKSMAYK